MPQIIVTADRPSEDGATLVMFRERVSARDFECDHLAAQLLQRVEWAVGDAHEADHAPRAETTQRAETDEHAKLTESLPA